MQSQVLNISTANESDEHPNNTVTDSKETRRSEVLTVGRSGMKYIEVK